MLHMGLVEEAKQVLSEQDGKTALQAIGYKELLPYFQGDFTLEEAVEHMKRGNTTICKTAVNLVSQKCQYSLAKGGRNGKSPNSW